MCAAIKRSARFTYFDEDAVDVIAVGCAMAAYARFAEGMGLAGVGSTCERGLRWAGESWGRSDSPAVFVSGNDWHVEYFELDSLSEMVWAISFDERLNYVSSSFTTKFLSFELKCSENNFTWSVFRYGLSCVCGNSKLTEVYIAAVVF